MERPETAARVNAVDHNVRITRHTPSTTVTCGIPSTWQRSVASHSVAATVKASVVRSAAQQTCPYMLWRCRLRGCAA